MKRLILVTILAMAVATGLTGAAWAMPPQADLSQAGTVLTQTEVDGLLAALNDEYHAWAVYDQVIRDFGSVRPFNNIRRSEATHINALVTLFEKYGVPVPANPWIGGVPSFDSVRDACAAGVDAEVANAALYDDLFESTERQDILTVYESLQQASLENHLQAFQRCSTARR